MGTAAGKAFLDMLGVFAEFESNLRKERQAEGIAAAKARGVDKRRKSNIDATFASSATAKSSGQPTSHDGSALATPVSTGCLGRRRHSHADTP